MKLLARLEKEHAFWFLIVILFVFFILRIPSLYEPYWYGDEGIYQVVGKGITHGRLLYRDIWDNKTPLLYILYGLLSSDQFSVRLISLISGIFSVVAFFFLAKNIFSLSYAPKKKNHLLVITTSVFAILFALPLLEGNIANAENFMILPILLAGIVITSPKALQNISHVMAGGLLLSIAFLFKAVALFDLIAFTTYLFIVHYKNRAHIPSHIQHLLPLIISFSIPIFVVAVFFVFHGAFNDFLKATVMQNVGYVGYGNTLFIPNGLLLLKSLLLVLGICSLFVLRKRFLPATLFISIWLFFSLFNALFSQRPYTHYLLVLLPSFTLFLGSVIPVKDLSKKQNSQGVFYPYQKIFSYTAFVLILIIVLNNFSFYTKIERYYQNFFAYIFNKRTIRDYQAFFDRNTPKDYMLAEFLNTHTLPQDNIFIWGNNAQLYTLTQKLPPGRFTVAYHMTANQETLRETARAINTAKPKYIIVTSSRNAIPFLLNEYSSRFAIADALIYERNF